LNTLMDGLDATQASNNGDSASNRYSNTCFATSRFLEFALIAYPAAVEAEAYTGWPGSLPGREKKPRSNSAAPVAVKLGKSHVPVKIIAALPSTNCCAA